MSNLIFIGTGSGKTSRSRFHSSLLFSTDKYNLLIDAGDGISKALLSQEIEYNLIDGIFITHLHPDHYAGLPSLITQMKMNSREKELNIYSDPGIATVLEKFIKNSYLFPEKLEFKVNCTSVPQNFQFEINGGFKVTSRQNSHLDSLNHLKNKYNQTYSSSSLLLTLNGKNIHYTSDIGSADDLLLFKNYKVDLLVSEITHIELPDIIEMVGENLKSGKIILTHIDEETMNQQQRFMFDLPPEIKNKIIFATDGFIYEI